MTVSKSVAVVNRLKDLLNVPSVMEQFHNSLGNNAGAFTASLVEMLSSDGDLQKCEPKDIIIEALKAASLKLPINKSLGFAWIIPRKINGVLKPCFQIGYRGYYQLAQRTGLYKFINTRTVPAGWEVVEDFKTGEITFIPPEKPVEGKPVGYFACFVQSNGYSKEMFVSLEWMEHHVKTYVYNYEKSYSPWYGDGFNGMAEKTVGSRLLSKYGTLSIEYMTLPTIFDGNVSASDEADEKENSTEFDIISDDVDHETGEVVSEKTEIEIPAEFID